MQSMPMQHTIDTPYMVGPVHCYTVELGGDLILFDTGPPTRSGRAYLRDRCDLHRLKHVFITHGHIDHYGQAAWLEQETGAIIHLPYRDDLKIRRHEQRLQGLLQLLVDLGFDQEYLDELATLLGDSTFFPPFPRNYSVVEDGVDGRLGIEVLSCPGHSQSDLVYTGQGWAVTGDILLRGIFQSPLLDVDLETGQRFKNYQAYCDSIVKLAGLSGKTILPGHRFTIDSVEAALQFYITKMLRRIEHLQTVAGHGKVADIVAALFTGARQDPFHAYLKASEVVFMQDFMARPVLLRAALERIGLFDRVAAQYRQATGS